MYSVDDRVSDDVDPVAVDTCVQEILSSLDSRRKAQVGDLIRQHAVHFLGEGTELLMRPESGLDMTDRDLRISRRESSHERCGGVSMDQDHVRLQLSNCIRDLRSKCRCQVWKRLALLHDLEISPHQDLEHVHDVVQHLHVLPGQKHMTLKSGVSLQRLDDRRHLNRLRARAKDAQNVATHVSELPAERWPTRSSTA